MEPGHGLEGGGSSGVALTDGVAGGSVAVGGVAHGDEGSVSVGEIAGLSISAPLASQTLQHSHQLSRYFPPSS